MVRNGVIQPSQQDGYIRYLMKVKIFFSKIVVVPLVIAMVCAFCCELSTLRAQEPLLGDVSGDGDITSVDASMALQIANGILSPTADQRSAADADQDGEVTSTDAEMILECAAEKCSAFTRKTIGPEGGSLQADDLTITIPLGAFSEEVTISIKTIDAYPIQYENLDALGSFYQLDHFPQIQEPITIEISFDPSVISTEDSVYIYQEQMSFITGGVGEVQSGHPRLDTEVDRINGTATIHIFPYETNPAAVSSNNLIKPTGQQGSYRSNGQNAFIYGDLVLSGPFHPEVKDDYFHIIDYTHSETIDHMIEINQFLHEAKEELEKNLGFSFKKNGWPVSVYITNNLDSKESNVPAETIRPPYPQAWFYNPYINLRPGFTNDQYQLFTGHELFHVLQYQYGAYSSVKYFYQYLGLIEASSVWFEAKLSKEGKNYFSGRADANKTFIYSPLETDDEDHGYGASSFLTYLTDQSEYGDRFIVTIYQKIKGGEDNGTGTGALQAALGSSEKLSKLFADFAFKFISKTTRYAHWPEPGPPPGGEIQMGPDQQETKPLNLSALSGWNLKVDPPSGFNPPESYKLVVSLEGGNQFIKGAVYTRDTATTTWQLACEFSPGETCEVASFFGNNEKYFANVILVNQQAEHPYDQVVPISLTLEVKEEIKSIVGTWDVTKYDYLCQGFFTQTGELHIYSNGTYKIDLSDGNIADFEGTWELKQEPHITENPIAYFYSNNVLKFIGIVNETYNEINCQGCISPANIIVCVHADKISDIP